MKILHISDTHGFHNSFPRERFDGIDLILHSGDCSNSLDVRANETEVRDFLNWYGSIPVKHKIFVAGNHDTSMERKRVTPGDFAKAGIIYLQNSSTIIEGIKFWGSPITPTFGNWAFMKARDKTNEVWKLIPENTDVLIVHGPPKGVRDLSINKKRELEFCGCSSLMKKCMDLKESLKAVCFGHIHNMDGVYNKGISMFSETGTIFSNGACVDDGKFHRGLTSFGNLIDIEK
jgi:predicted phosphodiesterase